MIEKMQGPRHAVSSVPAGHRYYRLVIVEVRKMLDYRAARWVSVATVAYASVAVAIALALALLTSKVPDSPQVSAQMVVNAGMSGLRALLPVLVILSATAEWSQRLGIHTFALEPRRARVFLGKVCATGVVASAAGVGVSGLAYVSTVLFAWALNIKTSLHLDPLILLGGIGILVAWCWIALGIGVLTLNTPFALIVFYLLPTLVSTIAFVPSERVANLAGWVDFNRVVAPILEGGWSSLSPSRMLVSSCIWILVPLGLGMLLLRRREIE